MTLLENHGTILPSPEPSPEPTREPATTAPAWHPVCNLLELEPLWGEAALVTTPGGVHQVALFLVPRTSTSTSETDAGARVYAVSNADPATGAYVMSRGIVGSKRVATSATSSPGDAAAATPATLDRPTIASPLHKDVFDLETGTCYTKEKLHLPTWNVRERDGVIEVQQRTVLVAASHGTSDPAGQRAVAGLVAAVRRRSPGITVLDSFVDVQQPDVPATLETLPDATPAAIVPLLLSAGYHVRVDLAEAAADAWTAAEPGAVPRAVTVTGALGPDARLASVLASRLRAAGLDDGSPGDIPGAPGTAPADRIVLAAAGSSDADAVADCHTMGELLSVELGRPVTVSFISAAEPRVPDAVAQTRAEHPEARVVVATYLLAPGYFAGLAAAAGADVTSDPLLVDDGAEPPVELVDIVCELYAGATR